MTLNFKSEISRINENIAIEFPTITPENSIDFSNIDELACTNTKALKQQTNNRTALYREIAASTNSTKYSIKTIKVGKHIILPLDKICKNLGITYRKIYNDTYSIKLGKKTIRFTNCSNEIEINNATAVLSLPIMNIENQLYVPSDFIERYLNANVVIKKSDSKAAIIKK